MNHNAIIFDLDDTLYDRRQPFIATCEEVFGDRFSIDYKKLYVARCHYGDETFDATERGEMTTKEMYIDRLSRALGDFGESATPEEILYFEERYQYHQKHICLRPSMREILEYLQKQHIKTGLITNGPSRHQRMKLNALNIESFIPETNWCISGDIGITKPDSGIFRAAEKILNTSPDMAWYIGDNYSLDIEGAKKAGWHAIWFNTRGSTPKGSASTIDSVLRTPDFTVTSVAELQQLLYDHFE